MDIIKQEETLIERIEGLKEDIEAIQQPRSNYVLEHFVAGMHDMPGRQRMQVILELQLKLFAIRRAQLDERKLRVKINQQKEIMTKPGLESELAEIKAERYAVDLGELNLARMGAIREAQYLLAILDKLPKYTYEELQKEEAAYWQARLSRQALQEMKAVGTVGQGNLEAIGQMFKELGLHGLSLDEESLRGIGELGQRQEEFPAELPSLLVRDGKKRRE